MSDEARPEGLPAGVGEDVGTDRAGRLLALVQSCQRGGRFVVEGQDPTAGAALGCGGDRGAVVLDELLDDGELLGVEVDVRPAQSAGLASVEPGERDEAPHGVHGVVLSVGEELAELVSGPDRERGSFPEGLPCRDPAGCPDHGMRFGMRRQLDQGAGLVAISP